MKYCFGIDIGGTSIKCGLFFADGVLVEKWEIPTNREDKGAKIPAEIAVAIEAKLDAKGMIKSEVAGIGIGVPGPVFEDGTLLLCENLGWGNINIKEVMEELLGLLVYAGNDANVAALGEMWKGGGQGIDNMVMITLGTGVGGGIVLDGSILCGSMGAAAEIGHMIVDTSEEDTCGCGGHGHLEQYASATGIVRMAKKLLVSSDQASTLRDVEELSAKAIFDAAKEGDRLAVELVDQLGRYLALALTHVAATVDPRAFLIGGGVSRAGKILIDAIEKHYNNNILEALKNKEFRLAELGNDAGIYGAARMTLGSK